jgi:hypothetical protein
VKEELPKFTIQGKWKIVGKVDHGNFWGELTFDQQKSISIIKLENVDDELHNLIWKNLLGYVTIVGKGYYKGILKCVTLKKCSSSFDTRNTCLKVGMVLISNGEFGDNEIKSDHIEVTYAPTQHWLKNEIPIDSTDKNTNEYQARIIRKRRELKCNLKNFQLTIIPNRTELFNNPLRIETTNKFIINFKEKKLFADIKDNLNYIRNFLIFMLGHEVVPIKIEALVNSRYVEIFKLVHLRVNYLKPAFTTVDYPKDLEINKYITNYYELLNKEGFQLIINNFIQILATEYMTIENQFLLLNVVAETYIKMYPEIYSECKYYMPKYINEIKISKHFHKSIDINTCARNIIDVRNHIVHSNIKEINDWLSRDRIEDFFTLHELLVCVTYAHILKDIGIPDKKIYYNLKKQYQKLFEGEIRTIYTK